MRCIAILCLTMFFGAPALAQEWGDLTIHFVFDGRPPKSREILVDKDQAACGKQLVDESLIVNAKDRGIANVVMWLHSASDEPPVPTHPALKSPAKEVVLSVKGCRYDPHIILARTSQTLVGHNHDPIGYAPKISFVTNNNPSALLPASDHWDILHLTRAEPNPVSIECSIHPWMRGWLFVHDNPYMAVSDASGKLTIPKLPAGIWTFRLWHERRGYVRKFAQDGWIVELPKQGWALIIKPGENDLGTIWLKPAHLERN